MERLDTWPNCESVSMYRNEASRPDSCFMASPHVLAGARPLPCLIRGDSGRGAMELSGSRVLVTGGSRGIGEALARRFGAEGARVALVARSAAAIDQLAAELGGTAHAADLTDPRQVGGLVERIEAEGGPVDVLVNNAGMEGGGTFDDETAEDLEHLFRLNLLTPAELTRQVLPGMLRRGRGHLVNISSLAGCAVFPGMASYSSSKAGLSQLTAGLRADLRGTSIGTTLVELGPIPTEMLDRVEGCEPV